MKRLISLLLALLLMTGVLANIISVSADESAPVVVQFNDDTLKRKVAGALGVSGSSDITDEMMLNLTSLSAGELDISDLTGLEYAKNLEELSLYDNYITDLSPLSDLENLRVFAISNNFVTSLDPISKCTKLTFIDFSRNAVNDISAFENMADLQIVIGNTTNISDISPLKKAKNLQQLLVADNNISDISVLSDHVAIWDLDLYGNNVSDISALSNMQNLQYVDLAHNKVTDISPLLGLSKLKSAKVHFNDLVISANSDDLKNIDTLLTNGVSVRYTPMNSYTVTFYVNDEVYASEKVEYGLDLTNVPEVPQVAGATGKWSVSDFTNITKDIDVNAIYEVSKVNVSFYVDGELYQEVPVEYGSALTELPEVPEIEGKNVSWDVDGLDLTNITSDLRINAKIENKQYTVKFMVNGEVYATKTVDHGTALTDIPAVPEVAGKTGKWNITDFSNIINDIEVEAIYDTNIYTVSFYVDGSLYDSKTVEYGAALGELPATPELEGKIVTWDVAGLDLDNITSNLRIDANIETKQYTVKFIVNGEVYATKTVDHGTTLTDIPAVPEVVGKTGAWNVTNFSNITSDIEVEAVYQTIKYTVSFYVDGSLYDSKTVEYGAALGELPATPELEGKIVTWYVAGLDLDNITSNLRIDANIETKQYTVKFIVNGEVYATKTVDHGTTLTDIPAVPEVVGKTGAWNVTNFSNITSDIEVEAVYQTIKYTVSFYVDGSLYDSKTVEYGAALGELPATPVLEGKIVTWDVAGLDLDNITSNLRIDANIETKQYTVKFIVNGETYATKTVDHGTALTDIPAVPEVVGKDGKWNVTNFSNITSDIEVEAVYQTIKYTVSFYVDGSLYDSKTVEYGAALGELPATPELEGKIVTWDVAGLDLDNITSDLRIDAKIETKQYTVKFIVNGEVYATKTVDHGTALTDIPAVPEVAGKTGMWSVANFSNITSDIEVEAIYSDFVPTITFYVNGKEYAKFAVAFGGALADIPEVPQQNGYYASWDTDSFENIVEDIEVNAVYEPMVILEKDNYVVKAKDKFTITLTTRSSVTNIGIMNESGKFMGKSGCVSVIDPANPEYKIWTITTSIATKGLGRQLGIWIKEDDQFVNAYAAITADVLVDVAAGIEDAPKLAGDNAITVDKNNVKVNEEITITVKTNREVTNVKLTNEAGKALGKVSQSSVDEGNVRTWTFVVKFGSKGANRRIDVSLCDKSGNYTDVLGSTESITVVK